MDNNGLEDIFAEVCPAVLSTNLTLTCPEKHPPCMTHILVSILVSPEGSAL